MRHAVGMIHPRHVHTAHVAGPIHLLHSAGDSLGSLMWIRDGDDVFHKSSAVTSGPLPRICHEIAAGESAREIVRVNQFQSVSESMGALEEKPAPVAGAKILAEG